MVRLAFVASVEAAAAGEPGHGAFDRPAMPAPRLFSESMTGATRERAGRRQGSSSTGTWWWHTNWLSAGVLVAEVSRRVWNSGEEAHRRYAGCIGDHEELNNRKIEKSMGWGEETSE